MKQTRQTVQKLISHVVDAAVENDVVDAAVDDVVFDEVLADAADAADDDVVDVARCLKKPNGGKIN